MVSAGKKASSQKMIQLKSEIGIEAPFSGANLRNVGTLRAENRDLHALHQFQFSNFCHFQLAPQIVKV